jgi:cytochrome d ubiquinol oxidase subunit II
VAAFAFVKTDGVAERARKTVIGAALVTVLLFAAGGFWVAQMPGYRITAMPDANSAFTRWPRPWKWSPAPGSTTTPSGP